MYPVFNLKFGCCSECQDCKVNVFQSQGFQGRWKAPLGILCESAFLNLSANGVHKSLAALEVLPVLMGKVERFTFNLFLTSAIPGSLVKQTHTMYTCTSKATGSQLQTSASHPFYFTSQWLSLTWTPYSCIEHMERLTSHEVQHLVGS